MSVYVIFIEIAVLLAGFTVLVFGMLFINPLTFMERKRRIGLENNIENEYNY